MRNRTKGSEYITINTNEANKYKLARIMRVQNKLNYDVQMRLITLKKNSLLRNPESDRNITLSRSMLRDNVNSSRRKTVVRKSSET